MEVHRCLDYWRTPPAGVVTDECRKLDSLFRESDAFHFGPRPALRSHQQTRIVVLDEVDKCIPSWKGNLQFRKEICPSPGALEIPRLRFDADRI
jgi:hypothetical protein